VADKGVRNVDKANVYISLFDTGLTCAVFVLLIIPGQWRSLAFDTQST